MSVTVSFFAECRYTMKISASCLLLTGMYFFYMCAVYGQFVFVLIEIIKSKLGF